MFKVLELENVIAVCTSTFALKTTHAQLIVLCVYATAVFGNEGPAFYFLEIHGQHCRANSHIIIQCSGVVARFHLNYVTCEAHNQQLALTMLQVHGKLLDFSTW